MNKKPFTIKTYTIITLIIVFFMVMFLLSNLKNKSIPKLITIAQGKTEKIEVLIRQKVFTKENLKNIGINDLLIINMNSKEEITYIDFNIESAYDILFDMVEKMQGMLTEYTSGTLNERDIFKNENLIKGPDNSFILSLPYGIISDNPYLANLGPEIIVKLKMYGNVTGGLETKITPYGINNSLIELYVNLSIDTQIVLPFKTEKHKMNLNILVASKIIEGIVPSFYNGVIQKSSSLLNLPLER